MSLVSGIAERVVPVGRLDYETEGLLVMTNDGDFSQMLQHPRFEIERCYRVKVKGVPTRIVLDKLRAGVFVDNVKTNRCKIKVLSKLDKNSWLEVRLKEGRNRQIRKMFETVGHDALRIIRTEFGPLELGALPVGAYRFLNKIEIEAIRTLGKTHEIKPAKKTAPKFVRKNYRSKVT
jgi:23S rRNA pseudouridine2605 synthase